MNAQTPLLKFLRPLVLAFGLATLALGAHADAKDDIKADMVAGRWPQAETRLTEVLKKHPDNALALYWYAQVLEKEGKTAAAKEALAHAVRVAPAEQFAGNKEQLARMMKRLGVSGPAGEALAAPADAQAQTSASPPALRVPDSPAVVETSAPPVERHHGFLGLSGMTWVFLAAGGMLVLLVVVSRRSGGSDLKQERERWTSELNDASKDLADAQLVSDSNPAFSEEQRLGNYDRVRLVKSDLSAHLAGMATRTDFQPTQALVLRARDVAADLRGEERPSERLRRENQDRLDREAQIAATRAQGAPYGNAYGQPPSAGGGLLRDAALLGGGALLGSMLAGSASAHGRSRDDGSNFGGGSGSLREVDDNNNFDNGVDVGGSDAGSDFDFGGSDGAGGGDDSFN